MGIGEGIEFKVGMFVGWTVGIGDGGILGGGKKIPITVGADVGCGIPLVVGFEVALTGSVVGISVGRV